MGKIHLNELKYYFTSIVTLALYMTNEHALKISKVTFKFHCHTGHYWYLSTVHIPLVNIFTTLVSQRDVKSFKARTGFIVTPTAASTNS